MCFAPIVKNLNLKVKGEAVILSKKFSHTSYIGVLYK